MPSITLGTRQIEYSVVKGRGGRYTCFRFKPDATLEVVTPRLKSFDAESEIMKRKTWVLRHFLELSQREKVLGGDTIMFAGRQLKLKFEQTAGREELRPDITRGEVLVMAHSRLSTGELLRRWFLKESSAYVVGSLPHLARRLKVHYSRADVREIKNWGYCTRDGRLSFSWQLIALPERLREYILCHELVHLSHHNHSSKFKGALAAALPDFRQRERELDRIAPI